MAGLRESKVIIASYGTPGILGIQTLFGIGLTPNQIGLVTHDKDDRNLPLHLFAVANDIEVVQYKVNSKELHGWISAQKPNLLVSLHYRDRIPKNILEIADCGCINLHPSLLPKYKGCFSIPWAIINRESETGYSYHYMVENFDEGNIIYQGTIPISKHDTAFSLFYKLIVEGLKAFENVLRLVLEKRILGKEQTGEGSYYPRKLPFNGIINPDWDIKRIDRFIRAMYFPPFKGALAEIHGRSYEISSIAQYLKITTEMKQ